MEYDSIRAGLWLPEGMSGGLLTSYQMPSQEQDSPQGRAWVIHCRTSVQSRTSRLVRVTIPGRSLHVQVAGAGSTQSTPREVRVELWSQESGWIVLADLVAPAPEVPVGPVEDAAHAIRYALMVNAPVLDVLS